jgi:hypothetical protein
VKIDLPDQTIQDVRALLAQRGETVDVSAFVNQTVKRAVFFDTVRELKRQNSNVAPDELDRLIAEAVEAERAERKGTTPDANGA